MIILREVTDLRVKAYVIVTSLVLILVLLGFTQSNGHDIYVSGESSSHDSILLSDSLNTPRRAQLKLSGEFDFLLKEEIHLQLAALLTDEDTGEPISEATVTFEVYDPDSLLIMHGPLVEEIAGSGAYINKSSLTMKDMDLPKGMYRVHAYAETPDGLGAIDMIQFHIDPPGTGGASYPMTETLVIVGVLGAVGIGVLMAYRHKKREIPSVSS